MDVRLKLVTFCAILALAAPVPAAEPAVTVEKGLVALYNFPSAAPLANRVAGSKVGPMKSYGPVKAEAGKAVFAGEKANQLLLGGLSKIVSGSKSWTFMIVGKITDLKHKPDMIASYADGSAMARRILEARVLGNGNLFVGLPRESRTHFAGLGADLKEAAGLYRIGISYGAGTRSAVIFANGRHKTVKGLGVPTALKENEPLRIGAFRSAWGPLKGEVYQVRVYDRALSLGEMRRILDAVKPPAK